MNKKEILEKHKNIKFPSFPNDDNFANWIEELMELDGYYYGLVVSILEGEKRKCDDTLFNQIKQRLYEFKDLEDDSEIYRQSEAYIASLEMLIGLVKNNHKSD